MYFIASFYGMVLIPSTYWFWPRGLSDEMKRLNTLNNVHRKSKWYINTVQAYERNNRKPNVSKLILAVAWVVFAILVYRAALVEHNITEYNPYDVLGVSVDADNTTIKKAYRQLSKQNHPDKGGEPEVFMRIRKAYEALTDEETRRNWEDYGNPDGPQAMEFGIALPSWIVDAQNSVWVLGAYVCAFMIILPVVVGIWWNKSIKYSKEQVLLSTTQLYFHFFSRTPNMDWKRALSVFSTSFEFWREYNPDIRAPTPEDNVEVPELLRTLGVEYDTKGKEPFINHPNSVKARALIYCHLANHPLPQRLSGDLEYILKKAPILVQEMVSCLTQLTAWAHAGRANLPRLETVESVMKLSQTLVQGLRDNKSPLLQLPYFDEDYLKYCFKRKIPIKSLRSLATLHDSDRRQMLRGMEDEEYACMVSCLKLMPMVEADARIMVLDDEEEHVITAGAIVTVSVSLVRKKYGDLKEEPSKLVSRNTNENQDAEEEGLEHTQANNKSNKKIWEVNKKKKGTKKKVKKVSGKKQPQKDIQQPNGSVPKDKDDADDSDVPEEAKQDSCELTGGEQDDGEESETSVHDDDAEWDAMQETFRKKKKKAADYVSKITHTVFAQEFPIEKQEWWWVYICSRTRHLLMTVPVQVCNLVDTHEIELTLPAPKKKGRYTYELWLRSDSYLGCDIKKELKFDVEEERVVEENHPQWNLEESDEEDDDAVVEESEDEGISTDGSD